MRFGISILAAIMAAALGYTALGIVEIRRMMAEELPLEADMRGWDELYRGY